MAPGKWIRQPLALCWVERLECPGIGEEYNYPQRKQQGQDQPIPSDHYLSQQPLEMKSWLKQTMAFLSVGHFLAKIHALSCDPLPCDWEWGLTVRMVAPAFQCLKTLQLLLPAGKL